MKKTLILLIFLIFLSESKEKAEGEVIFDEVFVDKSNINTTMTTAKVDLEDHNLSLPTISTSGVIDNVDEGFGYVVAGKNGIEFYEYDDDKKEMVLNPSLSCSGNINSTGVSLRQDNYSIWVISEDSLVNYRFNGTGMSNDPACKISGLSDLISVAAIQSNDSALVLQNDKGKAKITRYDNKGFLEPGLFFEPGLSNPVGLSMVGDGLDFNLFTKNAGYYFYFDDSLGNYREDPLKRIEVFDEILSGDSDEFGSLVITSNGPKYFSFDDSSGYSLLEIFSPILSDLPVAVSLKDAANGQVFINKDGQVQWWVYDDHSNSMIRDSSLEVSGVRINSGYVQPRDYYSQVFFVGNYNIARLSVVENTPESTKIDYQVSSDGGQVFTFVTPGIWTKIPKGDKFVVWLRLYTSDSAQSPIISRIALEGEDDFIIEGFAEPQPAKRGEETIITARARSFATGDRLDMDSAYVEYPSEVGSVRVPMVFDSKKDIWSYTFTVPSISVKNKWPDNGVYKFQVTGIRGIEQKKADIVFQIQGHILERLRIRTIKW
ncbi:MAG: hypothetical protein HGA27_06535 [Peptococcaceae bacterium]|nr:hypothetical protein [Peptococcaceae bacterium]